MCYGNLAKLFSSNQQIHAACINPALRHNRSLVWNARVNYDKPLESSPETSSFLNFYFVFVSDVVGRKS